MDELIDARGTSEDLPQELTGIEERFSEAMDDDFNTPRALAVLFEAARTINRISGTDPAGIPTPELLTGVKDRILHVAREVLGILRENQTEFLERARKAGVPELGLSEELIQQYIVERAEARKSKNFARADEIRNELASKGIVLEDTSKGTIWKVKES
jgi:cysteinyl-tRNA synthetase